MTLQRFLNKFSGDDFLLTVSGWCDELPFCEYEEEKHKDYWNKYKDKKVLSVTLMTSNGKPELNIKIEK